MLIKSRRGFPDYVIHNKALDSSSFGGGEELLGSILVVFFNKLCPFNKNKLNHNIHLFCHVPQKQKSG
jgi:hypothetical protein